MIKLSSILIATAFSILPILSQAASTNFTPQTAAMYLKLVQPVVVESVGLFCDGGSLGMTLVDVHTNRFLMFEDRSMGHRLAGCTDLPEPLKKLYANKTNTYGRIFMRRDKAEKRQLTSIEKGRLIKKAIICISRDWLDKTFTEEEQKSLLQKKKFRQMTARKPKQEVTKDFIKQFNRLHAARFIRSKWKKKLKQETEKDTKDK